MSKTVKPQAFWIIAEWIYLQFLLNERTTDRVIVFLRPKWTHESDRGRL